MTCSTASAITAGRKRRAAESRRTDNRRASANKALTSSGPSPTDTQHPNPATGQDTTAGGRGYTRFTRRELPQSGYINLELWCGALETSLVLAPAAGPVPLVFKVRRRTFDFLPRYSEWSPLPANRVFATTKPVRLFVSSFRCDRSGMVRPPPESKESMPTKVCECHIRR